MQKDVTLVPKSKCPMDVLAELGERTKKSWIFLHDDVVKILRASCDKSYIYADCIRFFWDATEEYPTTSICVCENEIGCWKTVTDINAPDISFERKADDPDEIFFIKMDE